jgi:C4-dicarboxylate-specific signal transduction histidine kinase
MEEDANRAADVISSLQSFYKRGAPVNRQIVNAKNVIEEMAILLGTEAARHSVTITTEIDEDAPSLLVDRVQLQQVFMNLMLNAIEAVPPINLFKNNTAAFVDELPADAISNAARESN